MDLKEEDICFRTLLQRLMTELVSDKVKRDEASCAAAQAGTRAKQDLAKEAREARKLLALERSQQRQQADPNYFKKREEANESGKTAAEEKRAATAAAAVAAAAAAAAAAAGDQLTNDEEEEEHGEGGDPFAEADPFRSYVDKSRSKIYIR